MYLPKIAKPQNGINITLEGHHRYIAIQSFSAFKTIFGHVLKENDFIVNSIRNLDMKCVLKSLRNLDVKCDVKFVMNVDVKCLMNL